MHHSDVWANGDISDLLIEGVTAQYIELADETLWSCFMNATIFDTASGDYCIGQYSFGLIVQGGIATATPITVINEVNNTAYTMTFDIDTATNTAQHRINLEITGIGATPITFYVTASINYQQNKLT